MPNVVIRLLSRFITLAVMLTLALMQSSYTSAGETILRFNRASGSAEALPPPPFVRRDKVRPTKAVQFAEHIEPVATNNPIPKAKAASVPTELPQKLEPRLDKRRLAPRSRDGFAIPPAEESKSGRAKLPISSSQIESLTTAGTGLAVVVGLFLLCVWLLRRGGPKPNSPLPKEVVSVLGKVPLVGRNFAQLIQIGNKLILVSITPDGAMTPITEVTEPAEVDRLLGLCMRNHKHSTTAEFQQVLQQLAKEPARGFLGNQV